MVSGKRIKRMGFANFNFHFLYVVDSILPFVGDWQIIKILEKKSVAYRSDKG